MFLLGLWWRRLNASGAMTALLSGFVLGACRLVLELNKGQLAIDGALHYVATMNFLHFAIALFVICSALLIVVSLLTRPASDAQLAGLTFQTAAAKASPEVEAHLRSNPQTRGVLIVLTILLAASVGAVWLYFS